MFGKLFLGIVKTMAQALLFKQLDVIKKNNSPEFYKHLLKSGDEFFAMLLEVIKDDTLRSVCEIFTVPIKAALDE